MSSMEKSSQKYKQTKTNTKTNQKTKKTLNPPKNPTAFLLFSILRLREVGNPLQPLVQLSDGLPEMGNLILV